MKTDTWDLCGGATIIEPSSSFNNEASSFIVENYNDVYKYILKEGIREDRAQDLLEDVLLSIIEAERNGEGFDANYGEGYMDVSQFVLGRIKLYCKNSKYRSDIVDEATDSIIQTIVHEEPETNATGDVLIRNNKIKMKRTVEKKKVPVKVQVYAASSSGCIDDESELDSFQVAFALASVSDSTDDIAEMMDLRSNIDTCIDFCSLYDVNILNIFRNIDTLASMLSTRGKKKSAESVFYKLSELVTNHDEFADALRSVLSFSAKDRPTFDSVLATFN